MYFVVRVWLLFNVKSLINTDVNVILCFAYVKI